MAHEEPQLIPTVIPDASVSVKWANPDEPDANLARTLLQDWMDGRLILIVPNIWDGEVTQGILQGYLRGQISYQIARRRLRWLLELPIPHMDRVPPLQMWDAARRYLSPELPNREKFGLHDALYVGWAEYEDALLVTEDGKILSNRHVAARRIQVFDLQRYNTYRATLR